MKEKINLIESVSQIRFIFIACWWDRIVIAKSIFSTQKPRRSWSNPENYKYDLGKSEQDEEKEGRGGGNCMWYKVDILYYFLYIFLYLH